MATRALEAVTANEILPPVGQIAKTREIKPAGPAILHRAGLAHHIFHDSRDAWPHNVLAEVVPQVPAGIADAVRIQRGLREQHQSRGLERGCRQHNYLGLGFVSLTGIRVDESYAASFAADRIHRNSSRGGIGAKREVARIERRENQTGGRIECRMNIATAGAPLARSTTETPVA